MGIQTHLDKFHERIKLGREDDAYKAARKRDYSINAEVSGQFTCWGEPRLLVEIG